MLATSTLSVMDFVRPVQAVIPGAPGRILAVLAETTAELNLRTIARLAAVSNAQASRVLPRLVDLGIVDRREVPPSALFRYVPENVAARAITALSAVRRTVLDEVGRMAGLIEPQPASVIVFGSFARGEAGSESDLDIVVVRDGEVAEDDDRWGSATAHFRQLVKRLTGNPVEIVETDTSQISGLLRTRKPLWRDVRRDGVVVFGASLDDLAQEGHG